MRRYEDVVLNGAGVPIASASVDVYTAGTVTAATLYSDDGVTALANPVTTDSLGRFSFYVADGLYDLRVTGTGLTTYTQEDVEVVDLTGTPEDADLDWQAQVLNKVRYANAFEGANFGTKVQAAIDDLPAAGGTVDARGFEGAQTITSSITFGDRNIRLLLPPVSISGSGDLFSITTSSNTNISIIGNGVGATQLSSSNAGGRAVVATGTNTVEIRDLSITASITKTSGYAIDAQGAGTLRIQNVLIDTHFNGIFLGGSRSNSLISHLQMSNIVTTGIQIDTTGGVTYINRVFTNNSPAATGTGLLWSNGNDLRVDNSDFINYGYGFRVSPSAGKTTQFGFFTNTSFDTSQNDGILFEGSAGTAGWITFTNCWSTGSVGYGINYSTAQAVEVRWIGGYILANGAGGVLINADNTMFSISGALIRNENQNGIIVGAGFDGFSIVGNRIGGTVGAGTQATGILVNAGASDQYNIIGNDLRNNSVTGLNDGGTGINKRIWGNVEATIPRELIYSALRLTNTAPRFEIYETDGAVDNKWWDILADAETLSFRILNDADSVASTWLTVDRTGTTIDLITLGGATSISSKLTKYRGIDTVSNGIPTEYATVDLTAQTAAVGTTTIYAVPADGVGQYRVSWNAKVTTAATTGAATSTLGALTLVYTDPDAVVQTITAPASIAAGTIATTSTGNSTTTVLLGLPLMLNCKASTNITYAMAYASDTANQMQYNLHIKLEAM